MRARNPQRVRAAGLVIKDGKLLLIERTKLHDHYYSIPGGEVDPGETPGVAAAREVLEETSIRVTTKQLLYKIDTRYGKQFFYLCGYLEGEPALHPDSSEAKHNFKGINHYKPQWVPLSQLATLDVRPIEVKQALLVDSQQNFTSPVRDLDIEFYSPYKLSQLKELGQHWLFDRPTLKLITKTAKLSPKDAVLEIGPGLGTLTRHLVRQAGRVVAVEKDKRFVKHIKTHFFPGKPEVVEADIMSYNLRQLPIGYKVVANIPYYLTSNLLRMLLENPNPPALMVLLIQKEVAQRITAIPGQMSVLAFSVQYYAEPELIAAVPKELFVPPPKVDSAIVRIKRRPSPAFMADTKLLFRLVKAGFSGKRKQLKNSLAGGLRISTVEAEKLLADAGIDQQMRAQELNIKEWEHLYKSYVDNS